MRYELTDDERPALSRSCQTSTLDKLRALSDAIQDFAT
jgi:hypothetical protein